MFPLWRLDAIARGHLNGRKTTNAIYANIFSNNVPVFQVDSEKYLGVILDSKLTSDMYIKWIVATVSKTIDLIQTL